MIGLRRQDDSGDWFGGADPARAGSTLTWNLVHIFRLDLVVPGRAMMARQEKTLQDLFLETLKDIYYAENKILKTLPKMAKAAQSKELRSAFLKHERETVGQVKRLDRVFKLIGKPARGKACEAINGITAEGAEMMKEYKKMPALDAGLLAAAQAVEHYEISRYGTLKAWAEKLGYGEAASLFQATLQEEEATDQALSEIAETAVNAEAQEAA
jgi:ferritin-like metal-binding protein YciE